MDDSKYLPAVITYIACGAGGGGRGGFYYQDGAGGGAGGVIVAILNFDVSNTYRVKIGKGGLGELGGPGGGNGNGTRILSSSDGAEETIAGGGRGATYSSVQCVATGGAGGTITTGSMFYDGISILASANGGRGGDYTNTSTKTSISDAHVYNNSNTDKIELVINGEDAKHYGGSGLGRGGTTNPSGEASFACIGGGGAGGCNNNDASDGGDGAIILLY